MKADDSNSLPVSLRLAFTNVADQPIKLVGRRCCQYSCMLVW